MSYTHLAVVGEAGEGARLQQAGILCGRLPLAAQAHQCGGAGLLGHHQAGADVLEVDVCSAARLEGSLADAPQLESCHDLWRRKSLSPFVLWADLAFDSQLP